MWNSCMGCGVNRTTGSRGSIEPGHNSTNKLCGTNPSWQKPQHEPGNAKLNVPLHALGNEPRWTNKASPQAVDTAGEKHGRIVPGLMFEFVCLLQPCLFSFSAK